MRSKEYENKILQNLSNKYYHESKEIRYQLQKSKHTHCTMNRTCVLMRENLLKIKIDIKNKSKE